MMLNVLAAVAAGVVLFKEDLSLASIAFIEFE